MFKIYVTLNENNVINKYGVSLFDNHIPVVGGVEIDTDLDLEQVELTGNYKFINGKLIKMTEEEKQIDTCSKPTIEEQLLTTQKMLLSLQEQIIDMV